MKDTKSNPRSYAIVFHLLIGIFSFMFAVIHGFHLPQFNNNLIFFFIAAILWGGGTIFLFNALRSIEISEVTILGSFKTIIIIIASLIFLHESFNAQKIIGTTFILTAILLVSQMKNGMRFNKGIFFVLLMALFYGSATVVDAAIVNHYDPISYLAFSNILVSFILFVLYPKALTQIKTLLQPTFLQKMIPLGFLSATQAIAFYLALAIGGHVAQMGTINQTQIILTIVLASIFLKERDHILRKLIAGILTTIGIILLR